MENNLYMYYSKKSQRVKVCPLYPSETARFQVRQANTVPSVIETTLTTQSENQNVGCMNLVYIAKSFIYLNTVALSNTNSLILPLISSLVCKLDHIQNPTFCTLIASRFTYCFINTVFALKYNIPTNLTALVELNYLTDHQTTSFPKQLSYLSLFHLITR